MWLIFVGFFLIFSPKFAISVNFGNFLMFSNLLFNPTSPPTTETCLNGGVPSAVTGSCRCPPPFGGEWCEHDFGSCYWNDCFPGSVCAPGINSFTCECAEDRVGVSCQFEELCRNQANVCLNGGRCFTHPDTGDLGCHCPSGFIGDLCQFQDPCLPHPCHQNAQCSSLVDKVGEPVFKCSCPQGFHGDLCQFHDACVSRPCENEGICLNHDDDFFCMCPWGFEGVRCETRRPSIPVCTQTVCLHGGVCLRQEGSEVCVCPSRFFGDRCEQVKVNPCDGNLCQNGGRCAVSGDYESYSCDCDAAFEGSFCEFPSTKQCRPETCVKGVCIHTDGLPVCDCPSGYDGDHCQIDVNECADSPCLNGGVCFDHVGYFHCVCPPGFLGDRCEASVGGVCWPNPCLNDGICVPYGGEFECRCAADYHGKNCEIGNATEFVSASNSTLPSIISSSPSNALPPTHSTPKHPSIAFDSLVPSTTESSIEVDPIDDDVLTLQITRSKPIQFGLAEADLLRSALLQLVQVDVDCLNFYRWSSTEGRQEVVDVRHPVTLELLSNGTSVGVEAQFRLALRQCDSDCRFASISEVEGFLAAHPEAMSTSLGFEARVARKQSPQNSNGIFVVIAFLCLLLLASAGVLIPKKYTNVYVPSQNQTDGKNTFVISESKLRVFPPTPRFLPPPAPLNLVENDVEWIAEIERLRVDGKVNVCDEHGRSMLLQALDTRRFSVAHHLLSCGIDLSICDVKGRNAVFSAVVAQDADFLRILLQQESVGVSVNASVNVNCTPLKEAVLSGRADLVQLLLQHKEIDVDCVGDSEHGKCRRETAAMVAITVGNLELLQILIAKGAKMDAVDATGKSVLRHAIDSGSLAAVDLVIAKVGPDCIDSEALDGRTPSEVARAWACEPGLKGFAAVVSRIRAIERSDAATLLTKPSKRNVVTTPDSLDAACQSPFAPLPSTTPWTPLPHVSMPSQPYTFPQTANNPAFSRMAAQWVPPPQPVFPVASIGTATMPYSYNENTFSTMYSPISTSPYSFSPHTESPSAYNPNQTWFASTPGSFVSGPDAYSPPTNNGRKRRAEEDLCDYQQKAKQFCPAANIEASYALPPFYGFDNNVTVGETTPQTGFYPRLKQVFSTFVQ